MSARSRLCNIDQRPNKTETVQPQITSFDQLIPLLIAKGLPVQFGLVELVETHQLRFMAAVGPVGIPIDLVDADRELWLAIADAVHQRFPMLTRDELVDQPTDGYLDHGLTDQQIATIEADTGLIASSTY